MAHIPDGFLSAPVVAGTALASAGALVLAARRSRSRFGEQEAHVLGATTAFVFAAQMLNFPLGAGTSAHLVGGVLVAVLVGPWAGMLVLFSVLLVQALLFQDGGIAALGANTLNIAVVGVGFGYLVYRWLVALLGAGVKKRVAAAAVAAWFSLIAGHGGTPDGHTEDAAAFVLGRTAALGRRAQIGAAHNSRVARRGRGGRIRGVIASGRI
ncbi:MAG: energy-coupling factor ABC transporter permease [Gemmatimonadales bacterium]